jgi:hypothetical protein
MMGGGIDEGPVLTGPWNMLTLVTRAGIDEGRY